MADKQAYLATDKGKAGNTDGLVTIGGCQDNALLSVIANMVDTDLLNRLLSSVSFMAMEWLTR